MSNLTRRFSPASHSRKDSQPKSISKQRQSEIHLLPGDILSRLGRYLIQATKLYVYSRLLEKIDVRFIGHSRRLHHLAQIIRSCERFRLVRIFD